MTNGNSKSWKRTIKIAAAMSIFIGANTWIVDHHGIAFAADPNQVIFLNNEGVKALNSGNFSLAIQKFGDALKIDSSYKLARDNLAIAYNNYGLELRNNPKEALKQFHQALYLNKNNATTRQNVEGIIRMLGKNPQDFKDRVEIADQARLAGDFVGAIVEYSEATRLKDDPKIHVKLGDVYRVRDDLDNAITEYQAAVRAGDSADVELKLGQAFQAKNQISDAISAYAKALTLKPDDPDVLDGLVTGWEAALAAEPLAPANHIGLGQAFQYRGDFGQAEQEYRQAIRLSQGRSNPTAERLLASLADAKKQSAITKHVNAGVDLQSRKLYDQAIDEYKQALQSDPNNDAVWVNLGTAYQAKEDYDNALAAYQHALSLNRSNDAAQQGIKTATAAQQDKTLADSTAAGANLFKQGNYDEAIAQYEKLLKLTPSDPAIYFNLGASYQAKKDMDTAIANYRQAVIMDKNNKSYQKALADALELKAAPIIDQAVAKHKAKDYTGAIELYQNALSIQPDNASLWYDLASAQYSRQDYQSARDAYKKALEVGGNSQVDDLYFMAAIDENFGRGADALGEYQKYMVQAPGGRYLAQAKDRASALSKNINDTVKIKSETELAQIQEAEDSYQQAVKLQQQKQFDQALSLYQKAIDTQPRNPDYNFALGTLYQQKGDLDNAIKWYTIASQIDPKNKDYQKAISDATSSKAEPLVEQAVQKQTSGDLQQAIDLYKQALACMPNYARAWTNLGTAYQQTDQFQQARDAYQKGYDLGKKDEVGDLYLIAAVDENFNQGGKALSEYQEYLRQAPTGQYAGAARDRIKVLSSNINNTDKLATQSDIKGAKEAQDSYDQAVKLQQGNNPDAAIPLYQKAIQLEPKESAYSYALGTAYQAKGDYDNAIAAYQKAITVAPANQIKDYQTVLQQAKEQQSAPIMDEAVKKHQAGDYAGAIELYQKALAANANNAHGWTNLAGAYQAMGNYMKAREAYSKALDLDKRGEADNWYFIGLLDENGNNGRQAVDDYQRYMIASPRGQYASAVQQRISALRANPSATQKMATAAETQKNTEAQAAYDEAVKDQEANKLDDAIAAYNKAIGISPKEPSYHYSLGTAYQAKNDLENAMKEYKLAESYAPNEPTYKQVIKQLNQAKAGPLVESAIKKQTTKNEKGEYDLQGAIQDYEEALKIDDDATTHMNLGTAYQGTNNLSRAISEYKRALQINKAQAVDAYYYLGTAYEAAKQPSLALAEYENYVRSAPTGANIADAKQRIKALVASRR